MKTDVVQKAIVLNNDGQLLALRRSQTDLRRPGQWDLPGGMLEPDENLTDGLRREIREEAGIDISGILPVYTRTEVQTWEEGRANVVRIFYIAKAVSTEVVLSYEHDLYKWVGIDWALKNFQYKRHKELFTHIIDNHLVKAK